MSKLVSLLYFLKALTKVMHIYFIHLTYTLYNMYIIYNIYMYLCLLGKLEAFWTKLKTKAQMITITTMI